MTQQEELENQVSPRVSKDDFYAALRKFDVAVCEACAVSQSIGVQMADAYIGWSTHIFARMCIHASIMIANVPENRWAKKDYPFWDLSLVASHTRALLEADYLFYYLSKKPVSDEEWSAKINVMHLNDCVKRIEFFTALGDQEQVNGFNQQRDEITQRLESNPVFQSLDGSTKRRCLNGKALTIPARDSLLTEMGVDSKDFKIIFDLLSHFTHILPMSYYRMEGNGRGTGNYNEVDMSYITMSMQWSTEVLVKCTDKMVDFFPETAKSRKGLRSKFSFGPKIKK